MRLRIRRIILVLALALLVIVAYRVWPSIRESRAVDSRLDAGGSYDYQSQTCDYGPEQTTDE